MSTPMQRRSTSDLRAASQSAGAPKPPSASAAASASASASSATPSQLPRALPSHASPYTPTRPSKIPPRPRERRVSASHGPSPSYSSPGTPFTRPRPPSRTSDGRASPLLRKTAAPPSRIPTSPALRTHLGTTPKPKIPKHRKRRTSTTASAATSSSEAITSDSEKDNSSDSMSLADSLRLSESPAEVLVQRVFKQYDTNNYSTILVADLLKFFRQLEDDIPGDTRYKLIPKEQEEAVADLGKNDMAKMAAEGKEGSSISVKELLKWYRDHGKSGQKDLIKLINSLLGKPEGSGTEGGSALTTIATGEGAMLSPTSPRQQQYDSSSFLSTPRHDLLGRPASRGRPPSPRTSPGASPRPSPRSGAVQTLQDQDVPFEPLDGTSGVGEDARLFSPSTSIIEELEFSLQPIAQSTPIRKSSKAKEIEEVQEPEVPEDPRFQDFMVSERDRRIADMADFVVPGTEKMQVGQIPLVGKFESAEEVRSMDRELAYQVIRDYHMLRDRETKYQTAFKRLVIGHNQQVERLMSQSTTQEGLVARLETDLADCQAQLKKAEVESYRHQQSDSRKAKHISKIEEELVQARATISDLNSKADRSRADGLAEKKTQESQKKQIAATQAENNQLRQQVKTAQDSVAVLSEGRGTLQKENVQLQEEVDNLMRDIEELKANVEALREENERLHIDLNDYRTAGNKGGRVVSRTNTVHGEPQFLSEMGLTSSTSSPYNSLTHSVGKPTEELISEDRFPRDLVGTIQTIEGYPGVDALLPCITMHADNTFSINEDLRNLILNNLSSIPYPNTYTDNAQSGLPTNVFIESQRSADNASTSASTSQPPNPNRKPFEWLQNFEEKLGEETAPKVGTSAAPRESLSKPKEKGREATSLEDRVKQQTSTNNEGGDQENREGGGDRNREVYKQGFKGKGKLPSPEEETGLKKLAGGRDVDRDEFWNQGSREPNPKGKGRESTSLLEGGRQGQTSGEGRNPDDGDGPGYWSPGLRGGSGEGGGEDDQSSVPFPASDLVPPSGSTYTEVISTDVDTRIRLEQLMETPRLSDSDARFLSDFLIDQTSSRKQFILGAVFKLAHKLESAQRRERSDGFGLAAGMDVGAMTTKPRLDSPLGVVAWPWRQLSQLFLSLDRADYESAGTREALARQNALDVLARNRQLTKLEVRAGRASEEVDRLESVLAGENPAPGTEQLLDAAKIKSNQRFEAYRNARFALGLQPQNRLVTDDGTLIEQAEGVGPDGTAPPLGLASKILRAGGQPSQAWGILTSLLWIALIWMLAQNVWMYAGMKQEQRAWGSANGAVYEYGYSYGSDGVYGRQNWKFIETIRELFDI